MLSSRELTGSDCKIDREEDLAHGRRPSSPAPRRQPKAERELEDLQLVVKARNGDDAALDALIRRYTGFVRMKASSYFLAGGDSEDLVQEGLIGLYKAVRDFRPTRRRRSALRRALRDAADHHGDQDGDPLQARAAQHVRLVQPHTGGARPDGECTLGDALPGPNVNDPVVCVISTEELQSLVFCLGSGLSQLEADALRLYLEGSSYEEMAEELGCDTKTIDNALQRVKRKVSRTSARGKS